MPTPLAALYCGFRTPGDVPILLAWFPARASEVATHGVAHLDDAVAQLQREVSVERLVLARGAELKAHHGVLTGACP